METRNYIKPNGTTIEISISPTRQIYVQDPLNCFTVYSDDVRPCIWEYPDVVPEIWWEAAARRFVDGHEPLHLEHICTQEVWERNFQWYEDHINEICDAYGDAYIVIGNERVVASYQSWDECINCIAALDNPESYSVCESNTGHAVRYGYEDLSLGILTIDTLTYQKYKNRVSKQ